MKKIFVVNFVIYSSISGSCQDRWTPLTYDHVIAYFAQQPLVDEEIIVSTKLNPKLSDSHTVTLSVTQIKKLNKVLTKKDRRVEYAIMDCFLPRHGIVFWTKTKNQSPGSPFASSAIKLLRLLS